MKRSSGCHDHPWIHLIIFNGFSEQKVSPETETNEGGRELGHISEKRKANKTPVEEDWSHLSAKVLWNGAWEMQYAWANWLDFCERLWAIWIVPYFVGRKYVAFAYLHRTESIWMIFYAVACSERKREDTILFSFHTGSVGETRRSNSTKSPMFNASIMRLEEREGGFPFRGTRDWTNKGKPNTG